MLSLTKSPLSSKSYSESVKKSARATDPLSVAVDEKPLDVLYIQAMDSEHSASKEHARKALKAGKVNYGEIKVNQLKGADEAERMESFQQVLSELRATGRLKSNTQVILSFKPAEKKGRVHIGDKPSGDSWELGKVIESVRSSKAFSSSSQKFDGTIHVFAHDPDDFKSAQLKKYGNLLMHHTGKSNWDHQQDHIVEKIIASATEIKGDDPMQRTRAIRNALLPHAGYPIVRVSDKEIKFKYPNFADKAKIRFYQEVIKANKNPIDMLIFSLEKEPVEAVKKRLLKGGLLHRIREVNGYRKLDSKTKSRLLIAVVATSRDQDQKLKLLSELGIKFSIFESLMKGGIQVAFEKNRDRIEPKMLGFLGSIGIKTVSKATLVEYLQKKISGNAPGTDKFIDKLGDRLKAVPIEDIDQLVIAAMKSGQPEFMLEKLCQAGLKLKKMETLQLVNVATEISTLDLDVKFRILDFFENNGIQLAEHLDNELERLEYQVFSKIPGYRENMKDNLSALITAKGKNSSLIQKLVIAALDVVKRENDLSLINFLLDCGLDPNYMIGKYSLLQYVFLSGTINVDLIDVLWAVKADFEILDENKNNLLHLLAMNVGLNRELAEKVAIMLTNAGVKTDAVNQSELSPVYVAAAYHNLGVLDALLPGEQDNIDRSFGPNGTTLLHTAMLWPEEVPKRSFHSSLKDTLDLLLFWDANPDIEDSDGFTPEDYIRNIKGYKNYSFGERRDEIARREGHMIVV